MKAIIHVCKRAPGVADLQHNYRFRARRSAPERMFRGSRVFAVKGDAHGVGVIMQDPGNEHGMVVVLSGPKGTRLGKRLRQIILSAESLEDSSPEAFQAALNVLMKAAKKWVNTYAPGCRWVAFAHQDRNHPHVHLVIENWDYQHGRRRLDLNPTLCSEMQNMTWCAGLGIVSGKGSMKRALAGMQLAEVGIDLQEATTWHERVELCAWNAFASRKAAAKELLIWCAETKPEKSVNGLLDALCSGPLPPGWEVKCKTKAGGELKEPAVKIFGTTLRLNTFLDVFTPVPNTKTIKPKVGLGNDVAL